jgi:predicted ester cyclase
MSYKDNANALRRLLDEAFGNGDYAVIDEIVAPDCVEHQNGARGIGPEAVQRTVAGLHVSYPDLRLWVEDIAAAHDMVWARVRVRGTDTGGSGGGSPSGKTIELHVIATARFRDGKMVEHWGVADSLGKLRRVRALPQPQQERLAA